MPDALESGRVKIQGYSILCCPAVDTRLTSFGSQKAQNFFEPQPARYGTDDNSEGVSVFLLCQVIHDWAEEYCLTILKHLRAAAGPKTQLVIVEQVMTSICDEPATHDIPGAQLPAPPFPLLRNLGHASSCAYLLDSQVRKPNE
jgi:hypothetical protein